MAPAAPKSNPTGFPALIAPQTQILLLSSAEPCPSHLCSSREIPLHSLTPTQLQSISKSLLERVQQEGCSNSHGGVAFINCCAPHPLYQLFWTHTFPTQAHARHLRVDNLPRQAVNTSHLMLPLRIMCLPVSPVM